MKRLCTILPALLAFALGAHAESGASVSAAPAAVELAGDLLAAMGAERQAMMAMEQVKRSQEAMLKLARLPPGQVEKTREIQRRIQEVIAREFSWAQWKDDYARLYAATFSEEELRELLAFYRSPIGATYVAKTPEIQRQAQEQVIQRMAKVSAQTREIMAEYAPKTVALPAPPSAAGPAQLAPKREGAKPVSSEIP